MAFDRGLARHRPEEHDLDLRCRVQTHADRVVRGRGVVEVDLSSEGKVDRLAVADASQPVAVRNEEGFV
jgi:hypothetical protein